MKAKSPYIALLVCALSGCPSRPPVHFYEEELTFTIREHSVLVEGNYYFKNLTSEIKIVRLFYPFVIDTNQYYPDTIQIGLPYADEKSGITFALSVPGLKENNFNIRFNQPIRFKSYKYITTTTRIWKRPIQKAVFKIIAPDTIEVKANYTGHRRASEVGYIEYIIMLEDFYPDADLIFEWD